MIIVMSLKGGHLSKIYFVRCVLKKYIIGTKKSLRLFENLLNYKHDMETYHFTNYTHWSSPT